MIFHYPLSSFWRFPYKVSSSKSDTNKKKLTTRLTDRIWCRNFRKGKLWFEPGIESSAHRVSAIPPFLCLGCPEGGKICILGDRSLRTPQLVCILCKLKTKPNGCLGRSASWANHCEYLPNQTSDSFSIWIWHTILHNSRRPMLR